MASKLVHFDWLVDQFPPPRWCLDLWAANQRVATEKAKKEKDQKEKKNRKNELEEKLSKSDFIKSEIRKKVK